MSSVTVTRLNVPAASMEVATGVTVRAGESYVFRSEGRWRDGWITCGPAGYRNFIFDVLEIRPREADLHRFCLVGMLKGRPETAFEIGCAVENRFEADGELVVFANDQLDRYRFNKGAIRLEISRSDPEAEPRLAPDPPAEVVDGLIRGWRAVLDTVDRTAGVYFVALLVLGVCFALALTPQGPDLVRSVTLDERTLFGRRMPDLQQLIFAATILFMGVQAWFWPRMIIDSTYGRRREHWRPRLLLVWGPRLLGLAPFVSATWVLLSNPERKVGLAVAVMIVAVIFFGLTLFRYDIVRRRVDEARADGRRHRPWIGRLWALSGIVISISCLTLFTWSPVEAARMLGAPAVIFLGVGAMIPLVVVAVQFGGGARLPVGAALIAIAAANTLWTDYHKVGERAFGHPVAGSHDQVSLDDAYAAWKAQAPRRPDGSIPMVLIAAEGGASRAGFWTGEVLSALHRDTQGKIARSLFAISSVSGGSVGAVGYVAALAEDPQADALAIERRVSAFTGADALSPVVGGLMFSDLFRQFVPLPRMRDRAEDLEMSWEKSWASGCDPKRPCAPNLLSQPFLDLWRGADRTWRRPLVIINGAYEETGHAILTSKMSFEPDELDAKDFYDLNPSDVPASTAIHNGARFPWVSPAGHMSRGGHIVDGGYYDPAGFETVRQLARAIKGGPGANDPIVFIVVRVGYSAAFQKPKPIVMTQTDAKASGKAVVPPSVQPPGGVQTDADPRKTESRFLNEELAPITAMFASRDGHGDHMGKTIQRDLPPSEGAPLNGQYVEVLLDDTHDTIRLPMDWALSNRAQGFMRSRVGFSRPRVIGESAFETVADPHVMEALGEIAAALKDAQ